MSASVGLRNVLEDFLCAKPPQRHGAFRELVLALKKSIEGRQSREAARALRRTISPDLGYSESQTLIRLLDRIQPHPPPRKGNEEISSSGKLLDNPTGSTRRAPPFFQRPGRSDQGSRLRRVSARNSGSSLGVGSLWSRLPLFGHRPSRHHPPSGPGRKSGERREESGR